MRMGLQLQLGTIITMMGIDSGAVAIYRNSGGNWSLGRNEAGFDQSGHTVELNSDGTRVVIGALNNDGNGDSAGHVRVYDSGGGTMGSDIDGDAEDGYGLVMRFL